MTDLELLDRQCRETFARLAIPCAYRIEKIDEDIPPLPFARYWFTGESLTGSDTCVGIRRLSLNIELITRTKRFDLENEIEKEFESFEARKDETYDTSDEVFVETFTFDVIQKIRR